MGSTAALKFQLPHELRPGETPPPPTDEGPPVPMNHTAIHFDLGVPPRQRQSDQRPRLTGPPPTLKHRTQPTPRRLRPRRDVTTPPRHWVRGVIYPLSGLEPEGMPRRREDRCAHI